MKHEGALQYVSHEHVEGAVFLVVRYRALGFLWWRRATYVRLPGREYWFRPEEPATYGNTRVLTDIFELAEVEQRRDERLLADG